MTKEQIDYIIEKFKNKDITKFSDFCENRFCSKCPMSRGEAISSCDYDSDKVIAELIERLLKSEEKKETNLEHWYNSFEYDIRSLWTNINLRKEAYSLYVESDADDMLDWLLSPYEEPKPKYKLSQFECDLLKTFVELSPAFSRNISMECCFTYMKEKGYFKDIPNDTPFQDILDNCEMSIKVAIK